MKTKILHWTSVLLASSALLLSACGQPAPAQDEDTLHIVATTYPVYNVGDIISPRIIRLFAIIKHAAPSIVVGIDSSPEC